MDISRAALIKLAAECGTDPRTVQDELAHPERWNDVARNRARERIRQLLGGERWRHGEMTAEERVRHVLEAVGFRPGGSVARTEGTDQGAA